MDRHIHWTKRQKIILLLFNFDVENVDNGARNIQWGRDSLVSKWRWGNWAATCKRMKLATVLDQTPKCLGTDSRCEGKTWTPKIPAGEHRL